MLRNYFLLNLLLISIIALLGFKLYNVLVSSEEMPSEASAGEVQKEAVQTQQMDRVVNERDFDKISKLDLFRPSRSAALKEEKKKEIVQLKNPPKLFGTVILNDIRTAILEDPDTKTTKVYRINDTFAGYKISEIREDRVVLMGNGDTVEVRLREDKGIKPPKRPAPRRAAQQKAQSKRKTERRKRSSRTPRRRPTRVRPQDRESNAPRTGPGGRE